MLEDDAGNGGESRSEVDSYRDRVGALIRDDHLLAYLRVVVADAPAPARRWWRRPAAVSAPTVTVHVRFLDDDTLHSTTLGTPELQSHLARWVRQQHVVYGDVYRLRWLDGPDARRVADRLFPLG